MVRVISRLFPQPLSSAARFLLLVCMLDTFSSALLFALGLAREANPLLAPAAEAGVVRFVLIKILTFVPTIYLVEWYGRRRPGFVQPLLRWAAWAYLILYVALTSLTFFLQ